MTQTTTAPETVQAGTWLRAGATVYTLKCVDRPHSRGPTMVNDNWFFVQGPEAEIVAERIHAALTNPPGGGTDTLREALNRIVANCERSDISPDVALIGIRMIASKALAAPTTPAPAGDGVEGLRALLGEPHCWVIPGNDTANGDGWIDARCFESGELSRPLWAFEDIRKALDTRTPAGAAGNPVGENELDHKFYTWTASLRDGMRPTWSRAFKAGFAEALAARPASQAPAASAGGGEAMRLACLRIVEHPNAGLVPPDGGDPTPAEMLANIAADIRALAPTAQGQPAGREKIARKVAELRAFAAECWEAGSYTGSDTANAQAAAYEDALVILRARPVADGGAESGWRPIETAPKDGKEVIVAVPSATTGEPMIVSAAYFDSEADDGSWWWSGTSKGDYFASPIHEINVSAPILWQPLPFPPTPATAPAAKSTGGPI